MVIISKVALVTNGHCHTKIDKKESFDPGKRKFANDAGDLQCLCHNPKCEARLNRFLLVKNNICGRNWDAVKTAVERAYSRMARDVKAKRFVGMHKLVRTATAFTLVCNAHMYQIDADFNRAVRDILG